MRLISTLFLPFLLVLTNIAFGQQTIRGTIIDQQTLQPLVGASIMLLDSDPVRGAISDEQGEFRIENVPVGRQAISISYYGYRYEIRNNLVLNSAQELVLTIQMEEQVETIQTLVIEAEIDKSASINELTSVSARTFSVEEALRYAGSRNDPARMAQNFAGVSGVNDERNDLIIRGNSPTGVLWRLEGLDVPNPNHFGAFGTTGGPVSMLNNNNLSDADFLTSAFPAEYGNAVAGVFDMGLRNGNNEQYEFMLQSGFNGLEAGVEGPFSKNSRASFIANYRYSLLDVMDAIGVDFGANFAVPAYQDLTFKVNVPTEKAGRFVLFGIGGNSSIEFLDSRLEDEELFATGQAEDLRNSAASGVVGLSHTYLFNETTYGKLTLGTTLQQEKTLIDSIGAEDFSPVRWFAESNRQIKHSAHYQLNKKFNARNHLRVGGIYDYYQVSLLDSVLTNPPSTYRIIRDFNGQTSLVRGYAQWQHRFSDAITLNTGLHTQYFPLNGSYAFEPRLGLQFRLASNQRISIGAGMHSQLQPLQVYFVETRVSNEIQQTNHELDFTRSYQAVLGYDVNLTPNMRLKSELYYQYLTDIPVEMVPSAFSMVNAGATFAFPTVDSLVNEGTGQNYGIELTLEKFFSDNYYFLLTTSLFDSKYTGSDGVKRNTAFNSNYIVNLLGGKEFPLGPHTLAISLKGTYAGGRRYTPIDVEASREIGMSVYQQDEPFSEQFPDYFRADVKTTFRMNGKRVTQEWSVDLQNVTGRQNAFTQNFSVLQDDAVTTYQQGFFPVVQYRLLF